MGLSVDWVVLSALPIYNFGLRYRAAHVTRPGKTNSHGSNTRTPLPELHALAFSMAGIRG